MRRKIFLAVVFSFILFNSVYAQMLPLWVFEYSLSGPEAFIEEDLDLAGNNELGAAFYVRTKGELHVKILDRNDVVLEEVGNLDDNNTPYYWNLTLVSSTSIQVEFSRDDDLETEVLSFEGAIWAWDYYDEPPVEFNITTTTTTGSTTTTINNTTDNNYTTMTGTQIGPGIKNGDVLFYAGLGFIMGITGVLIIGVWKYLDRGIRIDETEI